MDAVLATTMAKQLHVIFIPFPAQSHIKAMLKLARLLHHKGLHITFVNTQSNHRRLVNSGRSGDLEGAAGFQFKTVPDGLPSASDDEDVEHTQTLIELCAYLTTNFLASFLDLVAGLDTPPTCIISDGFMTFVKTIDAAEKLRTPIILYWTLAACGFMGFYLVQVLMEKGLLPLKDESYLTNGYLDSTELDWVPGMERIRLRDLPEHVLATKPSDYVLKFILETSQDADKVSHAIIHTFDQLEPSLVEEVKSMFPHVYTVGPLQLLLNQTLDQKESKKSSFNGYSLWNEEPECVQWLQSKEPNSVVYANFGSMVNMSLQDLVEFGWGLVNSNHCFLWIIRTDLVEGESAVLPPELKEAIEKRGFISSWCSQEEVLNHPSVGGFLTHGGWGSVIESLSAGVPMLCWPVSGDQRTNCRQMCVEWKVGMEIGKNVERGEVEKLVRQLMAGAEGKRMKNKAMEWKKMAEMATTPNGSSSLNVEKLVAEITALSRN